MFQREAGSVERLDHSVVEVHADAIAFLQYGQVLHLAVQAGILDGDGGLVREDLDEAQVVAVERVDLETVVNVDDTNDGAPDARLPLVLRSV